MASVSFWGRKPNKNSIKEDLFWLVQSIITGKGDRERLSPQDSRTLCRSYVTGGLEGPPPAATLTPLTRVLLCASPVAHKGCVKKVQMEKLRPRDCDIVSGSLAVLEIA